jgi:hypothetical protein
MPLARIITTSARYSDGLADDLRSRGFQVLTSAPGDSVSESADLEITLNECLSEDARAAATDSPVTKDMRVFVTPQAFAGNIRSIEMFVLTPQHFTVQKLEMETPVEPPFSAIPTSFDSVPLGKMLEFIAPAEVVAHDLISPVDVSPLKADSEDVALVEVASSEIEEKEEAVLPAMEAAPEILPVLETTQPEPPSIIGRAVLASTQASVPAWPDMREMKLVPAELAPAAIKSVEMPLLDPVLPQKAPASVSFRAQSVRDRRFWKVPIVVGIVAIFALSAVRLANHFSNSHAQAGTVQQVTTFPIEAAMPTAASPASTTKLAGMMQSSTAVTLQKPAEKPVRISIKAKVRASRPAAKRGRNNSESGYVARDTTVYFSKPSAVQTADQKALARP